jgi:hypothetical protein
MQYNSGHWTRSTSSDAVDEGGPGSPPLLVLGMAMWSPPAHSRWADSPRKSAAHSPSPLRFNLCHSVTVVGALSGPGMVALSGCHPLDLAARHPPPSLLLCLTVRSNALLEKKSTQKAAARGVFPFCSREELGFGPLQASVKPNTLIVAAIIYVLCWFLLQ